MSDKPMTPEEFAQAMREIARGSDPEADHVAADALIAKLLAQLGYGDGANVYAGMVKWYG